MPKRCSFCHEPGHTAFYCKKRPRKVIERKPIKAATRPLNKLGKYALLWIDTRKAWISKFGSEGHLCHYCGKLLSENPVLIEQDMALKLTLDHLDARTRDPKLRYVFSNLVPACGPCNKLKGSVNHDEFKHVCRTPIPYDTILI